MQTPLGKAQHKLNQWSNDAGPAKEKDAIMQAFRHELERYLDDLRDYNKRRIDPVIRDLSAIALPQDLIIATLIRVSQPACDRNEMFDLVNYVHEKYKLIDKDFDFDSVAIEDF